MQSRSSTAQLRQTQTQSRSSVAQLRQTQTNGRNLEVVDNFWVCDLNLDLRVCLFC
ncbi:hypothetical protein CsatB_001856 [Cannabis sativa]